MDGWLIIKDAIFQMTIYLSVNLDQYRITLTMCTMPLPQSQHAIKQSGHCSTHRHSSITSCLKKPVQAYFLSELCQISTDRENFWHKDSKEDKLF